jgi:hypothetical protein
MIPFQDPPNPTADSSIGFNVDHYVSLPLIEIMVSRSNNLIFLSAHPRPVSIRHIGRTGPKGGSEGNKTSAASTCTCRLFKCNFPVSPDGGSGCRYGSSRCIKVGVASLIYSIDKDGPHRPPSHYFLPPPPIGLVTNSDWCTLQCTGGGRSIHLFFFIPHLISLLSYRTSTLSV